MEVLLLCPKIQKAISSTKVALGVVGGLHPNLLKMRIIMMIMHTFDNNVDILLGLY